MERETVLFGNMVPWRVQRVEMIEGHRVIFLKVDTKAIQTGANAAVKMTQGIAKAEALSPDEAAQAKAMSQQYMTTDQIAAKLGKPSKAVYDYLHHGIMQLDTDVAAPVIKQSSLGNFDALTNTYSHYKYELTPTGGIKVWDTTGIHAQIVTYSSSQVVDFMTSSKVYNQDFHDLLTHAFPNVVPKVVSVIGKTVGSYTLQTNAIGDYKFTVDAGGNVFIKPIGLLPQKLNQGYIDKIKQEAIAGNWISPKGKAILKAFNVNTSPINKFGKFEYSILPSGQISVLDTETVGAPTATFTKKELEKLGNKSSLLSNYKDLYQHIFPDETPKIETPKVEPPKTEISVPGFAEIGGVKAKVVGKAVLITKKDGSQVKYATSSNYIKGVIANKDQFWKVGNQGLAVLKAMGLHESFREAESLAPVMTNLCGNIPNYVLSKIAGEAKQWAFLEMAGERQVFEGALMTGIENGWTRKQLSGVIQQVFSDGVHRIDPITGKVKSAIATESWAKTVARTELNRAFSSGEMTMYEYAGVKKIEWTAAGDENTCDECDAADGEIVNLGELFPGVDVDAPPGHPNCECAIMASDEDLISKRSNPEDIAWASRGGRTAEEYEQQFVFKHRVDQ
jgi:SPP1 gp7 family putative phage head morphogenesis protein